MQLLHIAHSHVAHGHSHGHWHSHANHTHHSERDETLKCDAVFEEPSSHIHFSLFGFELTLPDFLGGEPAPLVDYAPENPKDIADKGEVIQVPSPFSLAQPIGITLRWTAIGCCSVEPLGTDKTFCRTVGVYLFGVICIADNSHLGHNRFVLQQSSNVAQCITSKEKCVE